MAFEQAPPRIYVRNNTDSVITKLVFKFRDGTMDSKIKKIKPMHKELAAIPVWGVKNIDGAYHELAMVHTVDKDVFSDIILDRYDKRMNLLVEIDQVNKDGSFSFRSNPIDPNKKDLF